MKYRLGCYNTDGSLEHLRTVDNKESAKWWCELADKNLQGLLTPYKCYLRYYYYCDDGTDFIKTIDELKNTNIPIDNDTLEIFRMFG